MNINEKKEKFDSAIFRAYTDLVDNTLGYHDFDGKLKIQSITSLDLYTGDDNSDEKISFNREVITSGKLKYNTLEEAKNSIKMFKTFCDNYLIKFEKNTGIPFGGNEIHSMMLMVSKERFIIDNVLYPYSEAKYNKIIDIINFNENLLKETKSMQTEEYMSKHISYDNTSMILYVDNNINYKINCNTGDLSDEEINVKIIKPIEKIIREPLPEELSKLNSESNNLISNKVITKEEKIDLAKNIFSQLETEIDDVVTSRIEGVNIDICSPTDNQRGISAILIGDDGSYLVCGSIKPIDSYIEDYKSGSRSNFEKDNISFKKNKDSDIIWWVNNREEFGKHEFSFDKIKIYNLFRDYPYELSSEEIEIFDRENPYWADFFKDRKQSVKDTELEKIKEEIDFEKKTLDEYLTNEENKIIEEQSKLEKIKNLFFKNNEEFFDKVKLYLNETMDYDLLSNPFDNCVRFEIVDETKRKKLFFAINKSMFVLNDLSEHKLNLRGDSSLELFSTLLSDLEETTEGWERCYQNTGDYYWGVAICKDGNCNLYTGKSSFPSSWFKFIEIINNIFDILINKTKIEIDKICLKELEDLKLKDKKNIDESPFRLSQLKYTMYHWMSGTIGNGDPIKTSIEIRPEMLSDKWKMKVIHNYFIEIENVEEKMISREFDLTNQELILKKLESIDLKDLKNNYFSNDKIQSYSHWELEYNNYFKISGTFDLMPNEIKKIIDVLNCENIIKEELLKIEKMIKSN